MPRPTRPRPARRPAQRPVGRRQDRRGEAVRGPRLHRRRQPARRAAAGARRARLGRAGALRQGRDRARRPVRRRADRVRGDARRARGPRDPAAGLLPRGPRRGPDPALLGDAPPPPARRPARDRQLDRRGAPPARPGPRARPTSSSTRRDLSLRELRERIFARLGDAVGPGPARDPADQLRLQVRRPARGRPRVRRPVHAEPVLHRRAPPAVGPDRGGPRRSSSASPSPRQFLELPPRVPRRSRCRPTSARARPGSRSRSAAPAATTARSPSPRSWRAGCASRTSGRSRSSIASSSVRERIGRRGSAAG